MAKHIHVIGIGGIGTSSLAQIFHEKGDKISGSDMSASEITTALKRKGIKITIGHNASNIKSWHDLVIYSPAIPPTNEELIAAKKLHIKCLSYPEALGKLSKNYYTIAIAGTHGKSTTTAMTSLVLNSLDPTVVIGTKLRQFKNRNFRVGKSKYLVVEACEYRGSFLHLHPDILVITNIEAEHLDYFKNFEAYKKAFAKLAAKIPKNGYIIINSTDKNVQSVVKSAHAKIVAWKKPANVKLAIPGDFNRKNATAAETVGKLLGIDAKNIEKALKSFKGSWRRMQYKQKKLGKTRFIDDYGHHPTEIRLTLAAIREKHPNEKILCVFQPHQYSRTRLLLKEFGKSFQSVDGVIIPNIYRVRDPEEEVRKISTDDLVQEIRKHNAHVINGEGLKNTAQYIKKNHQKYDLIVTMGAGDISKIYKML